MTDEPAPLDELAAMRAFPSEHEWLDLELPSDLAVAVDRIVGGNTGGPADGEVFADRVLAAWREERRLDRGLAELDLALPPSALQRFAAPAPSRGFAERVVAAASQDRRHRWQALLARYVAPEPSPEFVSRTLAALATTDEATGRAGRRAGRPTLAPSGGAGPTRRTGPLLALTALAAAALLWLLLTDRAPPPLELRLARTAAAAVARAEATTPLAAVLARVAVERDPFALLDDAADGSWLSRTDGGSR